MLSHILPYLTLALAFLTTVSARADAQRVIEGLDHVSVAVTDLKRSAVDFEALGFTLKPGRPHENGLRNVHVKFANGTEIELITAPTAQDALSSEYHSWLKVGDGPAFLGIFAPSFGKLMERTSYLGFALDRKDGLAIFVQPTSLRRLFFGRRQRSATDLPEHFDHPNSAFNLRTVWMAGADAEQRLLQSLSGAPIMEARCGPLGSGSALAMPDGEIVFLPKSAQLIPDRSIVGVGVTVRSIEAAQTVLIRNRIPHVRPAECGDRSLWVGPPATHGMWIEFRQGPH